MPDGIPQQFSDCDSDLFMVQYVESLTRNAFHLRIMLYFRYKTFCDVVFIENI